VRPSDVPDGPLLVDTDILSYVHAQSGRYADFEPLLAGHLLAISFATYAEALGHGHHRRSSSCISTSTACGDQQPG